MAEAIDPYIFVSYSSLDLQRVRPIVDRLRLRDIPIRWDQDLSPGDDWEALLPAWRDGAAALLVFWTDHSTKSSEVIEEARVAHETMRLVPLRLDDLEDLNAVPRRFRSIHTVDGRGWPTVDDPAGFDGLVDVLRRRLQGVGPGHRTFDPTASGSASVPQKPSGSSYPPVLQVIDTALGGRWADVVWEVLVPPEARLGVLFQGQHVLTVGAVTENTMLHPVSDPSVVVLPTRWDDDGSGQATAMHFDQQIGEAGEVVLSVPRPSAPCFVLGPVPDDPGQFAWIEGTLDMNVPGDRIGLSGLAMDRIRLGAPIVQQHGLVGLVGSRGGGSREFIDVVTGDRFQPLVGLHERPGGSDEPSDPSFALTARIDSDASGWDSPTEDHLELNSYVTMLATVLSACSTNPPVSVGVFGPWGSGKTRFMQLLSQKMAELADTERTNRARDHDAEHVYVAEIRRIVFNAWHYADANLWASLASHIFEELADPRNKRDVAVVRREEILDRIGSLSAEKARLEAELDEAEGRRKKLQTRLDELNEKRDDAAISIGDIAAAVRDSILASREWTTAKTELIEAARGAGLDESTIDDPARLVDELSHVHRTARQIWGYVWRPERRKPMVAGFVIVVATSLLLGLLWRVWPSILTVVVSVASVLAMAERALGDVRRKADAVAGTLAGLQAAGDQRAEAQRAQAASELEQAAIQAKTVSAALAEAQLEVEEATRELASLSPESRWNTFVNDRHESSDYRSQLGIISTVRRDFEDLVDLLEERLLKPSGQPPGQAAPERIVLYIDDLDRCTPERVVEVLEAVHLLLAMDLFIVVVGVDPRWLIQSLGWTRDAFSTEHAALSDPNVASPTEYLEKIFQVPFVLPRLGEAGIARLLDTYVEASSPGEGSDGGSATIEDSVEPEHETEVNTASALSIDAGSVIAEPAASAVAPEQLGLTSGEVAFLKTLGPVVRTPRTLKRLANTYRLLRTTKDVGRSSTFLGTNDKPGEFRAMAILLAVSIGFPELYEDFCWAPTISFEGVESRSLVSRSPYERWSEFVSLVAPVQRTDSLGWRNGIVGPIDDDRSWRALHEALDSLAVSDSYGRLTLEVFQRWVPGVARFSFEVSSIEPADDGRSRGSS